MLTFAEADGKVISFAGIWSSIKVLDECEFSADHHQSQGAGIMIQAGNLAIHPIAVETFQFSRRTDTAIP